MIILVSDSGRITIDYPEQNVSADMEIKSNDTSGDTSLGDSTSGGIKPWIFAVSFILSTDNRKELAELINAAKETTAQFEPVSWRITNELANDIGVLHVCFSNSISIKKADNLHAYSVSFSLREIQSTAERKEERQLAGETKLNDKELEGLKLNDSIFSQLNNQIAIA